MAALAATTCKSGHFREYYLRKTTEGKNKMLVLNAVRSKLIATMFAVIHNDVKFDANHNHTEE